MDALSRFHEGSLGGAPFLRALLGHRQWWVPAVQGPNGPDVQVRRDAAGGAWLPVFGSQDTWRASGLGDVALTLPTRAWVGALGPALAGVDLDPGTPQGVHYLREQFGLLREWSGALDVEAVLRGDTTVPRPWHALRSHVGWRILVRGDGADRQLVLAPDSRGRRLAAVFTAEDAALAFLETLDDPEVRVEARPGLPLFADLARAPLDGLLFDLAGPGAPVALGPSFAEAVLDGVDPMPVPSVLPARSRAEMELYLDVLGCPPERPTRAETRDGSPVWVVDCEIGDRHQDLVFAAVDEPVLSGFGGPRPSRILDPAAFLLHGEELAERAGERPGDDVARRVGAVRLERAIRCLEEVLKFVPAHATRVPLDSFFSSAGRRLGRTQPERFSRDELLRRLDDLRTRRDALA